MNMSNKMKIKVKKEKEKKVVEKPDELTLMVRESLGSMGRRVAPGQEQMLVIILKSFLVGGISTIVDVIIYFILYHFVKLDPMIANAISFVIILIFSYFMSNKYVFDKNNKKQMVKELFILYFLGLILTEGIIFGLVTTISWNPLLVKIMAVVLVIIMKFLVKRFILNKKH